MTKLYDAIIANDIDRVRKLISKGEDINELTDKSTYHQGYTPLMAASIDPKYINILKLLIQMGADINQTTDMWRVNTALFRALVHENLEAFEILLAAGACPNDVNAEESSVRLVHWAAEDANPQFLKLLIEYGVDLTKTYGDGKTVLLKAIAARQEANILLLMEQGCRLEKAEKKEAKEAGLTDFILACHRSIRMSRSVEDIPLTATPTTMLQM